MKKERLRQMLIAMIGALMCRIGTGTFYPLISGYFAAALLKEEGNWLLGILAFAGMALSLPLTLTIKYSLTLLVIWIICRLCKWLDGKCLTVTAALAALTAQICISFGGELLVGNLKSAWPIILAEGIVSFASVFLFARVLIYLPLLSDSSNHPRQRGADQEKLLGYASSFNGLARSLGELHTKKEDFTSEELGRIHNEVTANICLSCNQCALCWNTADPPMGKALIDYISSLHRSGAADEQATEELKENCIQSEKLAIEATRVFERARLNLAWYNRLLENRALIAKQMEAMAYIMEDCATQAIDRTKENRISIASLKYLAKEQGIVLEDIHVLEKRDGRFSISLEARSRQGNCILVKSLTGCVIRAFDMDMVPHKDAKAIIGRLPVPIAYEEDTFFQCSYGLARRAKDGMTISGDNFSYSENNDGHALLMLSDGMGSGSNACKESELVLELMEQFVEAGFSKETALRMLGVACVLSDQEDTYSTVDVCDLDLYEGKCQFYKVGAAATFIKRGEAAECIPGGSLPVGADISASIVAAETMVGDGDFVVMITDGVLEDMHVLSPEDTICEILETIQEYNPTKLANQLLERVLVFTGDEAKDDMTILVAGIWEKN